MRYAPEKILYFVHVPKTAGTAVRIFLRKKWFTQDQSWWCSKEEAFDREKHRLVFTHFDRLQGRAIETFEPGQMITWLRDPVSIMASFYFYWIKNWLVKGDTMLIHGKYFEGEPKGVLDFAERFPVRLMEYLPKNPCPEMFLFCGFAEHMQASFDKLSAITGFEKVDASPLHNFTTWNEEFDRNAVLEVVKEKHGEFLDFYESCRKHWLPKIEDGNAKE